jgi:hypothetical protein
MEAIKEPFFSVHYKIMFKMLHTFFLKGSNSDFYINKLDSDEF